MRMKKIGLLALALVLALGTLGVGLAYWNETLTVTGSVATGELDVGFSDQKSNDDGTELDPNTCGLWSFPDPKVPAGWIWTGTRYAYNVGSTKCELIKDTSEGPEKGDFQTMVITVDNAYPCYYGNVAFTIDNIGTIPAHIDSIKLTEVSKAGVPKWSDGHPLVACTIYYVDVDATGAQLFVSETLDVNGPKTTDFSIHLSTLAVCQYIAVGGAIPGDICVHVEEGAAEKTTYDFTIEIVVEQFNQP